MRKSFLLTFALLPALCFGQKEKAFVVTHDGDTKSSFPLNEITQITFDATSGDMTVQTADKTVTFTETQQWNAVLEDAESTAIELVIEQCKDGQFTVYDLTGKVILRTSGSAIDKTATTAALLNCLPKGTYIINNGKKTFKVTR